MGLVFVLSQRFYFQLIAETVKYDGYLRNYKKKTTVNENLLKMETSKLI